MNFSTSLFNDKLFSHNVLRQVPEPRDNRMQIRISLALVARPETVLQQNNRYFE